MDKYLVKEIKQVGGKAKRIDIQTVKGLNFTTVLGLMLLVSIISSIITLYYIQAIPEIAKDGLRLNILLSLVAIVAVVLNLGFKKIIGGR